MANKCYYPLIIIMLIGVYGWHEKLPTERYQPPKNKIVEAFQSIDTLPQVVEYINNLEVNHEGGHVQGIQWIKEREDEYVVMTGSSSTYAYYAVVRLGDKNEVISVNKILEKPYKHAGGFQIHDQYMAVGIEDNEARNSSKIYLYHISDYEDPPEQPIAIIDRTGAYERATAGCVGITQIHNKIVLIVGDWNSRHLDFYIADAKVSEPKSLVFEKVYTINAEETNKDDWVDQRWSSYQNINLIKDEENNLFLVGMAQHENQDVADLFEIITNDLKSFKIRKVTVKHFWAMGGTSFRWGAGVTYDSQQDSMRIVSCTAHMNRVSTLNHYR